MFEPSLIQGHIFFLSYCYEFLKMVNISNQKCTDHSVEFCQTFLLFRFYNESILVNFRAPKLFHLITVNSYLQLDKSYEGL